ncbi:MAG TPA: c-type cytochrome, partial [Sediminibacterium sp.]|nr:c-type cytochrome [Sediminibacterium sp.]
PVLITTNRNGQRVKALAQVTKSGFIFLLNRKTGQPLYPIAEKTVPTNTELAGEELSPTQPMPDFPEPFSRQSPLQSEAELNHLLPDSSYQAILSTWKKIRHDHLYAPPSFQGTLILPGFDGGGEWGGPAYDTATDILYINASHMANILTMVPVKSIAAGPETHLSAGQRLYRTHCMSCHGTERQGSGNYPSLQQIGNRYDAQSFAALLQTGRRMMPAFRQLSAAEQEALASFLLNQKKQQLLAFKGKQPASDPYDNLPYTSTGYNKFISKEGYSAVDTPWGTLTAINLHTGKKIWTTTLGDYPEFKAKGIHTGTETYGGPVVTAGGLVFIASTRDAVIRAFNKRTGQLLWEHALPASGFATPALYAHNGKQYIVIACGGGKLNQPSGDSYIAFALPDK